MNQKLIATILDDGTYGQREMTPEEIAALPEPIPQDRVDEPE